MSSHATNAESLAMSSVQQKPLLPERSDQDLRKFQFDDPSIGFVLRAKEANKLPPSEVMKGQSLRTRRLVQLWPRLEIHNGVLWRTYEDISN